jgi:UTP--glucose-1-phosphate uridylyltransferase
LPSAGKVAYVRQPAPLGLGHAVWCARTLVGDEPFAVLLADDLIWNRGEGALKQMVDLADREQASVIAVQEVPREQTGSYGIVAAESLSERHGSISAIVEKPKPEVAPSTLAVVGRYVLSARIFDFLEQVGKGAGGEIQLTDALALTIGEEPFHGYRFEGRRFDCGDKVGFLEATMAFAVERADMGEAAREIARQHSMPKPLSNGGDAYRPRVLNA